MNIKITIIFLLVLLIIFLIIKCNNLESFTISSLESQKCNFNPKEYNFINNDDCAYKCMEYAQNNISQRSCLNLNNNSDNCRSICKDFVPTNLKCNVTNEDLKSYTEQGCIDKCHDYQIMGCNKFSYENDNGEILMADYSRDVDSYKKYCNEESCNKINDVQQCNNEEFCMYDNDIKKCVNNPKTKKFCNPCIKKCLECKDYTLCPYNDENRDLGCENMIKNNLTLQNFKASLGDFEIFAVPENKQVQVFWKIISTDNIEKFIVVITDNNNIHFTDEINPKTYSDKQNIQNSVKFKYLKGELDNNKEYKVIVNAVSTGKRPHVILSNTLNVVPTESNFVNFKVSTNENLNIQPFNLFNSLKGKSIDISI